MSRIKRTPYYCGTRKDFQQIISLMSPIKGIKGINETELRWFIHPETCSIVHLVRIEKREPFEDRYVWTETVYDPSSHKGFGKSGYKRVRLGKVTLNLHKAVAYTFVSNPHPGAKTIIHHKNWNKLDCCASNLVFLTPKEFAEIKRSAEKPKTRIRLFLKDKGVGE